MLSKTSPSASQSTYDKTPLLKGDGSNLVHFKKDFWRMVVQEGRPEVANNVIFGALPKTEASSKDYDFCVTSYRKVIKEKNRTVPPRGHEDLEVEPQHYVDGVVTLGVTSSITSTRSSRPRTRKVRSTRPWWKHHLRLILKRSTDGFPVTLTVGHDTLSRYLTTRRRDWPHPRSGVRWGWSQPRWLGN